MKDKKKTERKIKFSIMFPCYLFKFISVVYVILLLCLPYVINKKGVLRHGCSNILNLIMIGAVIYVNLRFMDSVEGEVPLILIGVFVKFFQIVTYMLVFHSKKIYFWSMLTLLFLELILTLFESFDKGNFRYTRRREDDEKEISKYQDI